jgi:hypothetical protein
MSLVVVFLIRNCTGARRKINKRLLLSKKQTSMVCKVMVVLVGMLGWVRDACVLESRAQSH